MIQKYLEYQAEDKKYYEIEKDLKSSGEAKQYYGLKKIMTDATEQIQRLDKEAEDLMMPSPSRSHCTAAPQVNTEPSSA